ncbi:MAG: GAF domain-containing protein, partial [Anaerolineales bacterium]|nr:GAF domain-containing protein [Anaerolineales bacterium]
AQFDADLADLKESTDLYEQNFLKTVQLSKERGFRNTGLEGQFRLDIFYIEERIYTREGLEPLVITMLQIRRHEEDYLLLGDQTSIDQTHQLVTDLKQQIASSDILGPAEKEDLAALVDHYVVSFDALVEKDVEIAAAIQAFSDAEHTIEPLVAKLTSTGADLSQSIIITARKDTSQTLLYSSITLIVAMLVAVFLSIILSRQITQPVRMLTNAAHELETGNYNSQAEVASGDELGALASAFNSMAARLRDFITTLEQRVAARTKDLAIVAEVGTATATILQTDKLLQAVMDLTKERFNLYHSHIYLLDQAGENLVLASGAGEPGRQMKAQGLSIPLDREQSLVARSARERKGVIVNDVTQAPDFLPNPLLPDTRSELAVPMIVGENVIGVFDVQSDIIGRFTDADINVQTTLAAQVSASIQNVRSFEQSKSQADLESLVNAIGQKIQRATTVDDTLQTAIREIGLALGASRVSANIGINRQNDDDEASRNAATELQLEGESEP